MINSHLVFSVIVITLLLHFYSGSSTFDKKDELLSQKLIDLNGDTLFLNDILKEKCLIFRYSILNCSSCIDSVFYYIHENEKFLGDIKILIFTYFTNLRHFIVTARLNQIKYEIFLIPENKLNIRQDNPYIPFFFLINENCNVNNFFFIENVEKQKRQIKEYFIRIANIK